MSASPAPAKVYHHADLRASAALGCRRLFEGRRRGPAGDQAAFRATGSAGGGPPARLSPAGALREAFAPKAKPRYTPHSP
jgi:hypothetical protein